MRTHLAHGSRGFEVVSDRPLILQPSKPSLDLLLTIHDLILKYEAVLDTLLQPQFLLRLDEIMIPV